MDNIPDIDKLIPQKHPFVMIDRLVSAGDNTASGELTVRSDNVLYNKGFLREPGIMEFMAQTAAAYTGFRRMGRQEKVAEGYIGAIKNIIIYSLPPLNSVIYSEIIIENEIVGYTLVRARVTMEGAVIAECEMRILT